MNSAKDFQLTFERIRSARQKRGSSRRSSIGAPSSSFTGRSPTSEITRMTKSSRCLDLSDANGVNAEGDGATGSSTKDSSVAHRNRPLTALAIHSQKSAPTADPANSDYREEYRPPRLTSELSMPAMHVMEAAEPDVEGRSQEPGRICSKCGCRQRSLDSDSELPIRSIGKAEDVVSIPSFGLEQLNLQHCKSQDEVEAELAKRVGVGIPGQEANEQGNQAEQMTQGTLSALFMLLCDAELLGEISTELRGLDGASNLPSLLALCKSNAERLQSSQDCSSTATELSSGLSAALLNKIASNLQWPPEARNNFNMGKKRKMPAGGPGAVEAVLPLWRRLKQCGWIQDKTPATRNNKPDRLTGMLDDIASGIDHQRARNKELVESVDTLKAQLRECRLKSINFEDRASKYACELERLKKALTAKSDQVRQLEAGMEAHRTASIGGMANELAGTRNSLEESQRAVNQLLTEKNHICRDLKEADRKRQIAERELEKANEELKQSTFERRELLAFQTRAANLMREKEVSVLQGRISELENQIEEMREAFAADSGEQLIHDSREGGPLHARVQHALERGAGVGPVPARRLSGGYAGAVLSADSSLSGTETVVVADDSSAGSLTGSSRSSTGSPEPISEHIEASTSADPESVAPRHPRGSNARTADGQPGAIRPHGAGTGPHAREASGGSGLKKKLEGDDDHRLSDYGQLSTSGFTRGMRRTTSVARPSTASMYSRHLSMREAQREPPPRSHSPCLGGRGLVAEHSAPVLGYTPPSQHLYAHHQQHAVGGGFRPDYAAVTTQARARAAQRSYSMRPSSARPIYGNQHSRGNGAREQLNSMMEPWSNAAQISGAGARQQYPPAAAKLGISGMKQTRQSGGTITCVRATGKVVVLHQQPKASHCQRPPASGAENK